MRQKKHLSKLLKKRNPKSPKKLLKKKKKKVKVEKMEVEEESSEEESSEEETEPVAEKAAAKKEESSEEEESEEEKEKPKAKKRKADNGEESAAKKQKEQVTMMFTDVPENLNDNSFKKYLKEHGVEVLSMRANWGRQKVFADISGDEKDAALKLDQHDWDGYVISVGVDAPRGDRQPGWKPTEAPAPDRDERTPFVKNLPYSADEDTIASYFEDVKEVRLLTDRESGRPKG